MSEKEEKAISTERGRKRSKERVVEERGKIEEKRLLFSTGTELLSFFLLFLSFLPFLSWS